MKRFLSVAFLGLLLSAPCLSQSDKEDDLTHKLSVPVSSGRVEGSFVEVLGQIAHDFSIPMGIAWVDTPTAQQKRTIEHGNATVLELIEQIANAEPEYKVNVANGVLHVTSDNVLPSRNFLYRRIPTFAAQGVISGGVQAMLMMRLNQLISPDPRRGYGGSIFHSADDPKLDLNMTNASVRDILDAIAVASNDKVWVVTFVQRPDDLTITGFRRTKNFLSKTFVPDEAQPVWSIFRWQYWRVSPTTP